MGQMRLFDTLVPYKYVVDTSSILSQKDDEIHRRKIYKKQWDNIDDLIRTQRIITCSEIIDEIKDKEILTWFSELHGIVVEIDEEIQENVIRVVTTIPRLIDFKQCGSSGDAFLIATAMKYNLSVITEESKNSDKKNTFCLSETKYTMH